MAMENPKKKRLVRGSILFLILACVLLCVILPRTNNLPEKYGMEFNVERASRGIPTLPADWRYFSTSEKRIWENPIWDKTEQCYGDGCDPFIGHYHKTVVETDENTLIETDIYLGNAIGFIDGEVALEKVMITCIYHLDQTNTDCSTDIRTRNLVYSGKDVKKAKEILNNWGIPYP